MDRGKSEDRSTPSVGKPRTWGRVRGLIDLSGRNVDGVYKAPTSNGNETCQNS